MTVISLVTNAISLLLLSRLHVAVSSMSHQRKPLAIGDCERVLLALQ